MQLIDHVVMAAFKWRKDPRCLQYREFEGSFQVLPALSVRNELGETRTGSQVKLHGQRAAAEVVGTQEAVERDLALCQNSLYEKVSDSIVLVRPTVNAEDGVDFR